MSEAADEARSGGDATRVAAGSSVVFVSNLFNRALRLVTNWFLSGALGPAGYGLYELARTIVTILASFAPLGTDKGLVLFAARYRSSGESGRLSAVLRASLVIVALGGPALALVGLGLVAAGVFDKEPGLPEAITVALPAVVIWAGLLVLIGGLRGAKDMRGQSLAYLVALPAVMLITAAGAVWLGLGLTGVLVGFVLSNLVAALVALPRFLRHYGPLIRERAGSVKAELRPLLRYSLPESLSSMLFRVNQWTDTLMVGALAAADDVGLYRVAVSLAMIGELPSVAVNTMFQPVVAELLYADERRRLVAVVRTVTRWLVILAAPVYLGLFVAQDVILAVYDSAYAASAGALSILLLGQAAYVVCVPVTALIPMSGRARLNLGNASAAAALNVGLNALMIPRYGIVGAATATGISLAAWSLWRVAQVGWLMRVQAFSPRALALGAVAVTLGAAARALVAPDGALAGLLGPGVGAGLAVQALGALVAVMIFSLAVLLIGREPDDQELLDKVKARLRRRFGR